jgi:NAD(P)-dependent dehydrogenase (short-subunit alcohol dehydrogenase family)
MNTKNMTVLITGANRGIGRAFLEYFAKAGVRRIYAGARDVESLNPLLDDLPSTIVPIHIDVTNRTSVVAAAKVAIDTNLLVNNAGVAYGGTVTSGDSFEDARREMEVNYFGLLEMSRAFAPVLVANSPSAMVNILSIASVISFPSIATYSASKAAALAATRAIRAELSGKAVRVIGVMPGFVDTDMTRGLSEPKMDAADVVRETAAALANGTEDIYPGDFARTLITSFFSDHKAVEKTVAGATS